RDIWRVDLPRDGWVSLIRRRLEFARIFAGQGNFHELHPDRQGGSGPSLFFAEGFLFVVAGHLGDVAWSDAYAVVRKHAESRGLLERRDLRRAQRHRKVGRNIRGNAEAVRVIDDGLDADVVSQLERGNVSGLGERAPQRDGALKFVVVVVRRIRAGGSLKSYGRVQNRIVGASALVDDGGIDVGLERRPNLAQRLRGAVELGKIEVTAADHGLDLSGRVVDGDERSFGPGVLLQTDARFPARIQREHFDVHDVAGMENVGELQLELGPGHISRRERGLVGPEADFRGAG